MIFTTSLGSTAKLITLIITIVFATLFAGMIAGYFLFTHDAEKISLSMSCIMLVLIYFGAYFFRPLNYEITNDRLVIHRPVKNVVLNICDIESAELLDTDIMKFTIRAFGVGGLFGYYGIFANWKIGKMTWYATRRDKTVLLRTVNNKKIVLTPDDPGNFINHLNFQNMKPVTS